MSHSAAACLCIVYSTKMLHKEQAAHSCKAVHLPLVLGVHEVPGDKDAMLAKNLAPAGGGLHKI